MNSYAEKLPDAKAGEKFMRKTVYSFFILSVLSLTGIQTLFAQERSSFEEANNLYAAKKYDEAALIYQKLLGETSEINEKAKIIYNLGMTYAQLKKFDKAGQQFQNILEMNVDNREPGGNLMQIFRNYHHNSQLEIAKLRYQTGDFESALQGFRNLRKKYPFYTTCGTCRSEQNYRISLYEAATLERLKRNREAFDVYFKIGHPRLIEIYAANGQLEKLIEITHKKNEPVIKEYMQKYSYTREKASEFLPTRNYEDYFMAYDYGKDGNVSALLDVLRKSAATAQDGYLKDWTAKMLARNPHLVIPLISAELKNLKTYPYMFYRTLGLTATPEALEVLKNQALRATGWYDAESIVTSFMLAGEAGEKALKELEEKPLSENMRLALQKYKNSELAAKNYLEIEFAPLKKAALPSEF